MTYVTTFENENILREGTLWYYCVWTLVETQIKGKS